MIYFIKACEYINKRYPQASETFKLKRLIALFHLKTYKNFEKLYGKINAH